MNYTPINNKLELLESSKERMEIVITALRLGHGVIVLDDESRENEADMIFVAETMTVEQMALAIRHGSGIVCLCITEKRRQELCLPMMVEKNTSIYGNSFTVSIEAAQGVTTGVSAKDRITTIRTAIAENSTPADLRRPGHIFPLRAVEGGIMERQGHTEATIELVSLAGFKPAGVLCELTNDDGTMAQTADIIAFSKKYKMPVVTINDILNFFSLNEN
ncbi:MAG: 3,4-dihydroxy-2-butanone-4-phosphate synthase [Candidatus Dasytiphilus stammeri]